MPEFKRLHIAPGYTLIEMIVTVVVLGILATVALKSLGGVNHVARLEETKAEMEGIAHAIAGHPNLVSNGSRTNFGYIGDNGVLPSTLTDLYTNGGGLSTWRGPYIKDNFSDGVEHNFEKDAWGRDYRLSGVDIISTGSGTTITRRLAPSIGDLLYNSAALTLVDIDLTPPGLIYKDSVRILLYYPDGSGSLAAVSGTPDAGGYWETDSLPIGLHALKIVYLPRQDTLNHRIAVNPGENSYVEIQYPLDVWGGHPDAGDTLLWADFNSDNNGFTYRDDTFRGTSRPNYPSGMRSSSGGYTGGALTVRLGNVDNGSVQNMSGGWQYLLALTSSSRIILSFRYNLNQSATYESNEYSDVLVSMDGVLYGTTPNDYIARLTGDGNSGPPLSTGWRLFEIEIGPLSSGSHTLIIGGYNNMKTDAGELTDLYIDDVAVVDRP